MDDNYWERILNSISLQTSTSTYEAWFEGTKGEIVEDTLKVICPNEFGRDWVREHYIELISSISYAVTGKELKLDFQSK